MDGDRFGNIISFQPALLLLWHSDIQGTGMVDFNVSQINALCYYTAELRILNFQFKSVLSFTNVVDAEFVNEKQKAKNKKLFVNDFELVQSMLSSKPYITPDLLQAPKIIASAELMEQPVLKFGDNVSIYSFFYLQVLRRYVLLHLRAS